MAPRRPAKVPAAPSPRPAAQQQAPLPGRPKPAVAAAKPSAPKPSAAKPSGGGKPVTSGTVFTNKPGSRPGRTPEPGPTFGQSEPGISPIPWNPNGPRTRNTPFGQNVPMPDGGDDTASSDSGFNAYAAASAQREINAIAVIKSALDQYGLSSLYTKIEQYVKEGYDEEAVMALIRTTPEYKTRFPAMEELSKKKRGISEAAYIQYEQLASGLERRYGLPEQMLMNNVTKLLSNEVSASELNDRVQLAASAAIQAPPDLRNTFQQYYGIGLGGQTAYFLDPDVAMPLLEKQFASAQIGTEAARQGIGIDAYSAQNLQSLGITSEQARPGFATVASERAFSAGRGDVVSQEQSIAANLAQNEEARKAVERARGARTGRFQGGGGFASNYREQSQSSLGTSSTA